MLRIEIKTDNAAFEEPYKAEEIGRILDRVAGKIANGYTEGVENDINGSKVCVWELED